MSGSTRSVPFSIFISNFELTDNSPMLITGIRQVEVKTTNRMNLFRLQGMTAK
jgi:hypothetical protein